jgi:integrase
MMGKEKLLQEILEYLREAEYKGDTSASLRNKKQMLYQYVAFAGEEDYSLELLQKFFYSFSERNLSKNTIRTAVRLLTTFTKYLYNKKLIKTCFSDKFIMPREVSKELHLLEIHLTEKAIIAGTEPGPGDNSRNRSIKLNECRPGLQFILRTGLRNFELRSISGTDLDLDADPPVVRLKTKGGRPEYSPIPMDMLEFLRTRTNRKRVFEVSADLLNTAIKRGCVRLGVHPINVHDLRHTFATHMLRRGTSLQEVSKLLHHKNVLVTDKYYSHYSMNDLSQAMNSNHVLIRQGINNDLKADYIRKALERVGINTNDINIDIANKAFSGHWRD